LFGSRLVGVEAARVFGLTGDDNAAVSEDVEGGVGEHREVFLELGKN
jgi:hypothetical protein